MRLLKTSSLALEFFSGDDVPPYAILSHTWDQEEVTLVDLVRNDEATRRMKGWHKIHRSCELARSLSFDYIWIDACCIDKSSSAELSEAINSMFRWYARSSHCIAWLTDVSPSADPQSWWSELQQSRWFRRGFTLQELLAPASVSFYSRDWTLLDTRDNLKSTIHQITRIPEEMLAEKIHASYDPVREIGHYSVAERMSWAADRETTRPEDIAYCLLGIFDVNMPLLYGEGRIKAFKRLQEEIIESTDDESVYSWRCPPILAQAHPCWGLLAESPAFFTLDDDFTTTQSRFLSRRFDKTPVVTGRGTYVDLAITRCPGDPSGTIFLAILDCNVRQGGSTASIKPAIILQSTLWGVETQYVRIRPEIVALIVMNQIVLPDALVALLCPGGSQVPSCFEAEPRTIFVPHDYSATRSPEGFIFCPTVPKILQYPDRVLVASRSPTWHLFAGDSETFELNFTSTTIPAIRDLKAPAILGAVELHFELPREGTRHIICIVVGLEIPSPNALGTPPLHFVPWYAFESRDLIAKNDFSNVVNKDLRELSVEVGSYGALRAEIQLQRRYSHLFYSVTLVP